MIEREHEGDDQRVALLHVLAALALEVVGEAGGQVLGRLRLQEVERLAHGAAGERHARQGGRVELLEGGQRVGLHRLLDGDDARQRHQRAGAGAHLVALQPVGGEPEVARHLRDHLVAAAVEVEPVDEVAAEQRRQRAADVLHGDAEAVGLVVVDLQLDLRRLELQVAVDEDEQAALAAPRPDLGQDLRQLRVVGRGGDHELHRRAADRAGQRRQREREHLRVGDLRTRDPAGWPGSASASACARPRA